MAAKQVPSLAVLGGTFDPVHTGHCRLAIEVQQLGFDQVTMVPNRVPPHRPQPQASGEQRLTMLQLATQNLEAIEVSDIELSSLSTSYTAETVMKLRQDHPEHALCWVMGADAWQQFDQWHQWPQILRCVNLMVINRPGAASGSPTDAVMQRLQQAPGAPVYCSSVTELRQHPCGYITFVELPALDIAASDLRRAIARGDNIDLLTPLSVQTYIQQHALYR